ncbi:hypothetical protein Q8A67_025115 [Cirrhinus molitorella]|uniref:Uncharacterized protein n=1 Tax=Cirrhinus molitorella TaxID=172907 RepID=A0AA88T9E2_9TELE|nr:hypothetical protein Q8A67_025115 [Cirrhinus molitorella]
MNIYELDGCGFLIRRIRSWSLFGFIEVLLELSLNGPAKVVSPAWADGICALTMLLSLLRSSKWDSGESSGRTVKGVSSSHGHSLKHRAEGQGKPIKHNRLGGLLMTPHLLVQPGMRCASERDCEKREGACGT